MTIITLDERELATVLAALRYWETLHQFDIPKEILDIAENGGTLAMLSDQETDKLCERLNCGDELLTESEEAYLKELEEEAELKKGEYLVTYDVSEEVVYSRSFKVDGAVLTSLEDVEEMVEADWVDNGDANKDMISVDERSYDGVWVTDQSGKCLSAKVFFKSR